MTNAPSTPGARYAADVARLARAAGAADVRVVELPDGLPNGWDLADPLPDGWTVDTVRELIANARPVAEETEPGADDTQDSITRALTDAGLTSLPESPRAAAVEAALRTLADLLKNADPLRRMVVRNAASDLLKACKVNSPTALVNAALGTAAPTDTTVGQGTALTLSDPEPWPDVVDGAALLDALARVFTCYVVLPVGAADALALWVLLTYCLDAFEVAPILGITSPEKECGKTTLLSVLAGTVRRSLPAANISPAAVYRTIEIAAPTLLVDEADSFLRDNDELRGVLNSGHTRATAFVVRCVGDDHEPRRFNTFCLKAIAAIGDFPETIESRAIGLRLKRRIAGEHVERIRADRLQRELEPMRKQALRWAQDHTDALREADPSVEMINRAADNWRPLFAIGDRAGGRWPQSARHAAQALTAPDSREKVAAKVQLLADLRALFDERKTDRLASEAIIEHLTKLEDRPWAQWHRGKPLTAVGLARLLHPFGVQPKTIRGRDTTFKGYMRAECEDAFSRYLPESSRHTVTSVAAHGPDALSHPSHDAHVLRLENPENAMSDNGCDGVTGENGQAVADCPTCRGAGCPACEDLEVIEL
jgi:hypothetical protein